MSEQLLGITLFEVGVFMNVDENDFDGALVVLFYFSKHGNHHVAGDAAWESRSIMVTFSGTGICISRAKAEEFVSMRMGAMTMRMRLIMGC